MKWVCGSVLACVVAVALGGCGTSASESSAASTRWYVALMVLPSGHKLTGESSMAAFDASQTPGLRAREVRALLNARACLSAAGWTVTRSAPKVGTSGASSEDMRDGGTLYDAFRGGLTQVGLPVSDSAVQELAVNASYTKPETRSVPIVWMSGSTATASYSALHRCEQDLK